MKYSKTYPPIKDVKKRVIAAICALYQHDVELITVNASERSITHKLAEYLQKEFPCWHVDCEYNRYGNDIKRIPNTCFIEKYNLSAKENPDLTKDVTVFPDIIIHQRGTRKNLVVIEVKKNNNDIEHDKKKLSYFSRDYKYGILLILNVGRNNKVPELHIYTEGNEDKNKAQEWENDLKSALALLGYLNT